MDIIQFVFLMIGLALAGLALALYLHRRRTLRKRDYTDPKRDHVYRRYNRQRQVIKSKGNDQPFEL